MDHLIGTLSARRAGPAAMAVINGLQHHRPEEQAVGLALAFILIAAKKGFHIGTALATANNILDSDSTHWAEIKAVRQYVENEL